MGNSASRIDRFYGNYEKSFDRIEKDVQKVKAQLAARAGSRASIATWTSALVVMALAVAVAVVYQVQQQPPGTFTYQQHFARVGGALSLPAAAGLLHWLAGLGLAASLRRDARKLQRLEEAKRAMLKELKDMSRFDKIKTLIDKFDPDARPIPAVGGPQQGLRGRGGGRGGMGGQGPAGVRAQQQMPALLVKGSGQLAGTAALAVAGAGRALMPLVDKLATSLMADNPVLLEDLRRAQQQLADAEVRTVSTVQEALAVRHENLDLKQRLLELEGQLQLPPSFEPEALQEARQQLHQQAQQAQQAAWQVAAQQQYLHMGGVPPDGSGAGGMGADGSSPRIGGAPEGSGDLAAAAATQLPPDGASAKGGEQQQQQGSDSVAHSSSSASMDGSKQAA